MRAMQGGENNSLAVAVIMKFNHILNCNHEVVMTNIAVLIKRNPTYACICQDLLGTQTCEVRMGCEICM